MNFRYGTIILLLICVPIIRSYEILFLVPFPGPSHWLMIQHFIRELLDRGHDVTAVTSFKLKDYNSTNYTEILIDPPFPMNKHFAAEDIYSMQYVNDIGKIFMYWDHGISTSEYGLENEKVKQLIRSTDQTFDLIVAEQFFQESWLMFAHKFNAPIITIGTYGYSDFMDRAMGLMTPWSHVPHMIFEYDDDMTFFQRYYNFVVSLADAVLRKYYYLPKQDMLAKKHFSTLANDLPSVVDLEKSISAMLINSHTSIAPPRPGMATLINIAGAHIKPQKALPADIMQFLNGAEHGAIYFSLGAYIQSAAMPVEKMQIILDAFKQLKQRVLWKFEDPSKSLKLPKNVKMGTWMPQNDILAHPKIVLFITHGGMFGTLEGITRGVPMLFMPFYGDQQRNALKCEQKGYALTLKFSEITSDNLSEKINNIISNSSYKMEAKYASQLLTDNPLAPMAEAIFWIEYIIRHKGAKHLKSAAVDLTWYQYYMLDIIGFILLKIFLIQFVIFQIFKLMSCSQKSPTVKRKVH